MIGAAAALAWPGRAGTYEYIAYRDSARWGTPRSLHLALGSELDRHHPSTFDNQDAGHRHLRIAPASPCPVLAGIRGTDAHDVVQAAQRLGPEPSAGGLLFATNQATDDHLWAGTVSEARPYRSMVLEGTATGPPATWRGGHVLVRLQDETGAVDVAAFEPTKEFREGLRACRPGDRVRAYGAFHADPTLLSLEKLEILSSAPRSIRRAPRCATCRRSMKSRGSGEPYRCPGCRTRAHAWLEPVAGAPAGLRWEVPTLVRRHLSRPWALAALAQGLVAG